MRYILHYTAPGDVVFDGFCGTGMTGVAAQLCGDRAAVEGLGYRVDGDGVVWDGERAVSRLGARRAVLNDLSPAATFIAYNYNTPVDVAAFEREARRILDEVEAELGWMYETWHPNCDDPERVKGRINYTVWSELFLCPHCLAEIILWEAAVDPETRKVAAEFACANCLTTLNKGQLTRYQETLFDPASGEVLARGKSVPVLISYSVGTERFEKPPDSEDVRLVETINQAKIPYWYPVRRIDEDIDLWYERDYRSLGIYRIDNFYSSRNLHMLAFLTERLQAVGDKRVRLALRCWLQSVTMGFSRLNRFRANGFSQVNQLLSGTLYIGSFVAEVSPWYALRGKTRAIGRMASGALPDGVVVSTMSTSAHPIQPGSLDYIFVDPPFGSNIIYSDLSIVWESWLDLSTNVSTEAVVHRRKHDRTTLPAYQDIMHRAFARMFEALKPGRWMTVEFHNTQNTVWNAIQEAILQAGFVVADVRSIDKQLATFKQVTARGAVKQDLVISAYKPDTGFEERFLLEAGTADGAWAFVRQHLGQLPVAVVAAADNAEAAQGGGLELIAERQDYLLFDRMVAFHVQRGAAVPLSAAAFYAGLRQRFDERDGMFFLKEQIPAYDAARLRAGRPAQLALFVSDEKSSLQWLRQQLDPALGGRPQTYQALQPAFLRALHQATHEALPELRDLLQDNFLPDDDGRWRAPDPNRAEDLERLRRRALLAEFETYLSGRGKLKQFRTEAVRAGFADAYRRKAFDVIRRVAERLPERVVQEDPDLLMYYDTATLRG